MSPRWIALGVAGFVVLLVAMFGVAFAVVEWRDDDQTQAIVIGRTAEPLPGESPITNPDPMMQYCVSYSILGTVDQLCPTAFHSDPPACYLDAKIGESLPDSCQGLYYFPN